MKNYKGHRNRFEGNVVVTPDAQPNMYPECFAEQAKYVDADDDLRADAAFAGLGEQLERAAQGMVTGNGSGRRFLKLVQIRNKVQDAFSIWQQACYPEHAARLDGFLPKSTLNTAEERLAMQQHAEAQGY